MDVDERQLHAESILGEQAEQWWQSDLGQYIIGRSLEKSERLKTELSNTDPEDTRKIREIQTSIKISEQCLLWMDEMIKIGQQAIEQLNLKDD